MAREEENSTQPDITAMLNGQTSACTAAREAVAAGGEVRMREPLPGGVPRRSGRGEAMAVWRSGSAVVLRGRFRPMFHPGIGCSAVFFGSRQEMGFSPVRR
ncbi:hypothetical protein ACQKM2_22105, partial [Streptomyces sp. NPDC004126]